MINQRLIIRALVLATCLAVVGACTTPPFRANYKDTNRLIHAQEYVKPKLFLKAHLINGDVCILNDSWHIDSATNLVTGVGTRWDYNRVLTDTGRISIPINNVALFETNSKLDNRDAARIGALTILLTANVAVFAYCQA